MHLSWVCNLPSSFSVALILTKQLSTFLFLLGCFFLHRSTFLVNSIFFPPTFSPLHLACLGFSPLGTFLPLPNISFLSAPLLPSFSPSFSLSVELSSLSLCMTNSKLGEPCFYVIGRTENTRLVMVPVSSPIFCLSTFLCSLTTAVLTCSATSLCV